MALTKSHKIAIAIGIFTIAATIIAAFLSRYTEIEQHGEKNIVIKQSQGITVDQSVHISPTTEITIGNLNLLPIPKDIKIPSPLGILEFDSKFKRARSNMLAGDYNKAADLFKVIYEIKPDYSTLALYYGDALFNIGKIKEALAAFLSIPPNEIYPFKNINIGLCLFRLRRFEESAKYFELAQKDFNKHDCAYWDARAYYIKAKDQSASIQTFINDVNKFTEIVDNDIRNLTNFKVKKDTAYEIDKKEILNEILSRKVGAFLLLYDVSRWFSFEKKNFSESLNYALKAADHLDGPVRGCVLSIKNESYIKFLTYLSGLLCLSDKSDQTYYKINSIMEKIEDLNSGIRYKGYTNQDIADYAMLIRSFHGDTKAIRPVKEADFEIIYSADLSFNRGIKFLYIESPSYLLGRKKINIEGKKKYHLEQVININPKVVLNEKPYFRISVEDNYGNTANCDTCQICSWIRMIKQKQ